MFTGKVANDAGVCHYLVFLRSGRSDLLSRSRLAVLAGDQEIEFVLDWKHRGGRGIAAEYAGVAADNGGG